jgi:tetratricopeptide (TPR) repeat protein
LATESKAQALRPRADQPAKGAARTPERVAYFTLAGLALTYACLAGFHTVQDFDLGWQLATGRWILQHHSIPSQDVLSHTAAGQPWIYPVLSQIAFYLTYLAGGFGLLSWVGALASVTTGALLLRSNQIASALLALVAVPLIAARTQPRADLFTTVLFAATLNVLWRHYHDEPTRLWLLPVLMAAWVNLHLGFVAGVALCLGYAAIELLHLPFGSSRQPTINRLTRAWPYLVAACAATLLNPWGVRIWTAVYRQEQAQQLHSQWLAEWGSLRPDLSSLQQAVDLRDPQSAFWWLLSAAAVACVAALWLRRFGAVLWLATASFLTIRHVRFQALFACVVVVVGGSLLQDATHWFHKQRGLNAVHVPGKTAPPVLIVVIAIAFALVAVRGFDLVTNRYYLRSGELASFGPGLASWFPLRAADFVRSQHLPANLFNSYSFGGFLTFQLGPAYPDYIDGRAVPFGPELFFRSYSLTVQPPDSALWRQESSAHNLNTVFVSLAAANSISPFPPLLAFCKSREWRPVHLDAVSAVFVRRSSENASQLDRLQIDCDSVDFPLPPELEGGSSSRSRAELFRYLVNSAGVLHALGRDRESLSYTDRAQTLFSENANLHLIRALSLESLGRPELAETEFLASLRLLHTDEAWFDLGLLYITQKRYSEAAAVFSRSAQSSPRGYDMWMMLGQTQLFMGQPQQALASFDKADSVNPFQGEAAALGARSSSVIATGRAKAWYQLGDTARAVVYQEAAVRIAPDDSRLWQGLADLYQAQGRIPDADAARSRAQTAGK